MTSTSSLACLPPAANKAVVLGAAAAGKHVVCEKPLGVTAEDAAELLHACRGGGRVPRPGRRLSLVPGRARDP